MKIMLSFCDLYTPSNHKEKISDKSQIEEQAKKTLTSTPQTVKVIRNKESKKNCNNSDESKNIWQLNVLWYLRGDNRTEKGH